MGGLCIRCGALRPEGGAEPAPGIAGVGSGSVALKYIHHGLEVSGDEAARLRAGTAQRALASRRLLLVLDLDHTLLNSSRASDLSPGHTAALHAQLEAQPEAAPLLYHLPRMGMWTRLRPGIREFLAAASELFDLHVYTMGDSGYAAGMVALLDPDGRLFSGRVASSRDAGPAGVKDLDVLLGADELVLVLDDTAVVWPRHRGNLLQVERYIYFPACAGKFGRR
jgi:RNA polymerase II C-terminal domain phosphatase-like 3/4